jgi:hypothetical protein
MSAVEIGLVAALTIVDRPALAEAAKPSFPIGPFVYSQDVNGVPVAVSVRAALTVQINAAQVHVDAEVISDLGDLQDKIGTIIDTVALPKENCRSFSADNPVVSAFGHDAPNLAVQPMVTAPLKRTLRRRAGSAAVGRVGMWRGGFRPACLFPPLSSGGALVARP